MTVDESTQTVHVANSLLFEIGKYTSIDLDNNVTAIAVQHNLAYVRMLELTKKNGKSEGDAQEQVIGEFQSLFRDMTSNQIIVLSVINNLQQTKPDVAEKLLQIAVTAAKELVSGKLQGVQLDETMLQRLSIKKGGLTGDENAQRLLQQLASDVLTAQVGLEMLPNLMSDGNLHAQTLPSQAYNLTATVRHARRLLALYELLSDGAVTSSRISIKIPSTIPGLQAMRYLSSAGKLDESEIGGPLPEGPIKVLGTAIFAVEQGIAAAQAGGASFVSPYINSLAGHFFAIELHTPESSQEIVSSSKRSSPEIVLPLQRCLLRLRKDNSNIPTLMKCASFLDPREAVELCGLDQFTMGAPIVDALAKTPMSAAYAADMQKAREQVYPASDDEMNRYGAKQASIDAQNSGYGGWLKEGTASYTRLDHVLKNDARCRFMLKDALLRFTNAEQQLRELF